MDSTARSRSISRNRPRPDSMSGSAFRSRPQSFATDTTPRSEVNEMSRYRNDDYYPQRFDFIDMPRFHGQDIFSNNENSIYNERLNNNSSSSLTTNNPSNEQTYNNANNSHHFLNTLPQTIINASQQTTSSNYHNSSLYRTPSDSEFEFSNALYRHASTSSRLRNMYQGDSTDDLMDDESDSGSSTSSVDSDDANEGQLFNWDASNDMDTSDDDSGSEDENGGYRRRSFSHRSSSSSISPISSSSEDEENENDNESIVTTSTNNSRPEINQHWYKPWSWYNNNHQETLNTSTISAPDSDATISSGEDFD